MREITYAILYTILYSKIGISFSLCCPNASETIQESCMCNVGPGRTYILSLEKRLFQICLVTCFFKRLQYHRTILALFIQCWLGSSFKACGTTRNRGRNWLEHSQYSKFTLVHAWRVKRGCWLNESASGFFRPWRHGFAEFGKFLRIAYSQLTLRLHIRNKPWISRKNHD